MSEIQCPFLQFQSSASQAESPRAVSKTPLLPLSPWRDHLSHHPGSYSEPLCPQDYQLGKLGSEVTRSTGPSLKSLPRLFLFLSLFCGHKCCPSWISELTGCDYYCNYWIFQRLFSTLDVWWPVPLFLSGYCFTFHSEMMYSPYKWHIHLHGNPPPPRPERAMKVRWMPCFSRIAYLVFGFVTLMLILMGLHLLFVMFVWYWGSNLGPHAG